MNLSTEPYSKKKFNQKYDMHKISRIQIKQDTKPRYISDYEKRF